MTAITYIGHATTLIEANGVAILTDPNFSGRVLLAKRRNALNYDPGKLSELSAVVISHAHFDHLDVNSFKYIKGSVPVFVPDGLGSLISRFVRNPVIELPHWSAHKLPDGTEITATYTQHIGFRWIGLRYRKCNGYIITANPKSQIPNPKQITNSNIQITNARAYERTSVRIFFAGDTGYGPHFKEIGKTYPIDIALLPIGGYRPRWLMQQRHLNPAEALEAFMELNAKHMIPIHFGEFKLSSEPVNEPAEWLAKAAAERGLTEQVHILKSGERFEV